MQTELDCRGSVVSTNPNFLKINICWSVPTGYTSVYILCTSQCLIQQALIYI